jgi:signal transduction histidine kinase
MEMGLLNAYNIVKKHHGELTAESEPGKGSTFRIVLPKKLPAAPEPS